MAELAKGSAIYPMPPTTPAIWWRPDGERGRAGLGGAAPRCRSAWVEPRERGVASAPPRSTERSVALAWPARLMYRDCLPAQVIVASSSASVVVGGFVHTLVTSPPQEPQSVDLMFLGLLGFCLLPSLIYLLGVRTCSMVAIFGACLFVPTVLAWLVYFFSHAALAGVAVIVAVPFTFLTSVIGTVIDRTVP